MKRNILGILNITSAVLMLFFYGYLIVISRSHSGNIIPAFKWYLPLLLLAILPLIGGIQTLRGKNWWWTIIGLFVTGLVVCRVAIILIFNL